MVEALTVEQWKTYFLSPAGQEDNRNFGQQPMTVRELLAYRNTPEGMGRFSAMEELWDAPQITTFNEVRKLAA